MPSRSDRSWTSIVCVAITIAAWALTIWIAHAANAVKMRTDIAVILSLCWTYCALWGVSASRSTAPRRTVFRAVAVTLSCSAGLLILEAPAVANLLDYRRLRETVAGPEGPDVDFVADPDLMYRREPNARWTGRPRTDMAAYFNLPFRAARELTFSTDARGFRNAQVSPRADIALIGDSYVEGISVSDDETAAVRLHERTGLDVVNFGVAGFGTLQELNVLRTYAVPLHPSLVAWFFFEGNDLDDDENFENMLLAQRPSAASKTVGHAAPLWNRWRGFADRSFVRNAWLQARQMTDWLMPNRLETFGWFSADGGRPEKMYFFDFYATRPFTEYEVERLRVTRAALQKAAEICRDQSIRLVLFYVPIKFRVYGDICSYPRGSVCPTWRSWDLEDRVTAICRDLGISIVSLTAKMRAAARKGDLLYLLEDTHWNAAGHAFAADEVRRIWDHAELP